MKKAITASVVVLMVAGSSFAAVGDILNQQEWALGLGSTVTFTQGAGSSTTLQTLGLNNVQNATNIGVSTVAGQSAIGSLVQAGAVVGNTIVGGAVQTLSLNGATADGYGQVQNLAQGCNPIAQAQGVGLLGTQILTKDAGPGAVTGSNVGGLTMVQGGSNICANMAETSMLGGTQTSQTSGGPCSVGTVQTTMTAGVSQIQQVN